MAEPTRPSTARPLVLASTSPYRHALLERLDVAFVTASPHFDEADHVAAFDPVEPDAFALRLARGKAASLRADFPDAWILGADQVAVLETNPPRLLHKPGTIEAAIEQLLALSGMVHQLITAVVLDDPNGATTHEIDVQRMTMRTFSREEAQTYVQRYAPVDCVGSYRVEDGGIRLIESIEGRDYTGIIGLPLLAVCRLLRHQGLLP